MKKCRHPILNLLISLLISGLLALPAWGQSSPPRHGTVADAINAQSKPAGGQSLLALQDCRNKKSHAKSACEKHNASVEYCKNSNKDLPRCMQDRTRFPAPVNCDGVTDSDDKTWCEKFRTAYFDCFKNDTDMDYYRCMSQFEKANPRPQVGIRVNYAWYGKNCEAKNPVVTNHIAMLCNLKTSCAYIVNHKVIGDPAVGCNKDFQVSYTCPKQENAKIATLPAEASGKMVQLSCP